MQTEALVLRAADFAESDRIVHLLTPAAGRVAAIAKGARRSVRRFGGTLDVFNRVQVEVAARRTGALARLESARLLACHAGLRERPGRFALASCLVELLDRLAPEGAAGAGLYGFAIGALGVLEASDPDARLGVLLELRALDALGLRPELERCVRCGGEPAGFHVAEGGAVCRACGLRLEGVLGVSRGTLAALAQALRMDFAHLGRLALPPAALAEARELVRRFQRFHVGLELRSERFADQIFADPIFA